MYAKGSYLELKLAVRTDASHVGNLQIARVRRRISQPNRTHLSPLVPTTFEIDVSSSELDLRLELHKRCRGAKIECM